MRTFTFAPIVVLALGCAGLPAQAQAPAPAAPPAQGAPDLPPHLPPPVPPAVQPPPPPAPPPAAASRFRFNQVGGGFVRLDSTTGKIAYCAPRTVGWSCESVPDNRAALEREIDRLHEEVAALRREVEAMRAAPPPPPPAPPADIPPPAAAPDKPKGDITLKLPTREEIAEARAYVADTLQDTWQRLVEMISRFHKDVMREG
jgi:hypothetical protein